MKAIVVHADGTIEEASAAGKKRYISNRDVEVWLKSEEERRKAEHYLLKYRICPECGKHMSFHIDFDFGGTLGVFSCDCGYKNSSYNNLIYATKNEREEFEEATKNIMW